MIISLNQIITCLRPNFLWDKKTCRWFLHKQDRGEEFFCKEIGILVFIKVAEQYGFKPGTVINHIGVEDMAYKLILDDILAGNSKLDIDIWKQQQVIIKSSLVHNVIKCNFNF